MTGLEGEAAAERQNAEAIADENERYEKWRGQHNPEPEGNYLSGEGWQVRLYGSAATRLAGLAELQEEGLAGEIAAKFKNLSDRSLIERIERAPDFGYDDESYELNRRLALRGETWRWSTSLDGQEVIEVYQQDDQGA